MKSENFSFSFEIMENRIVSLLSANFWNAFRLEILWNKHFRIRINFSWSNISKLVNGLFSKYWLQLNDITIESLWVYRLKMKLFLRTIQQKHKLYCCADKMWFYYLLNRNGNLINKYYFQLNLVKVKAFPKNCVGGVRICIAISSISKERWKIIFNALEPWIQQMQRKSSKNK